MKIREIFELIKTDTIANIARRDDVHLSEKPLRNALKNAGYEFRNSGNKGWYYVGDGDEASVLENSIYHYSKTGKATAKKRNTSTNESSLKANTSKSDSEKIAKSELLAIQNNSESNLASEEIAVTSESANKSTSESEYDAIDMLLLQNEDTSNKRVYRGFYWDKDVIDFVDNVKHGNKSDLMNEIVRTVLKAKGLI
ncbi:hypothetical protein [Peribacillus frigoritolerans]|uniref:hypothetical protein n=1 Tax=Peribacillus frigoritolerans TaxID=450367 RepID=UPI001059284A|nr:hypothetical protein [Peribacillus frigoritolerans]TDL74248.1 hypothetical protein E2R53_22855 [Peribacillus frigoritolerans]